MADACHILHVDDDAEIRLIVALSLAIDPGLKVSEAPDVEAAEAALGNSATPLPDALLLDYFIAGTDGVALLEKVRNRPLTAGLPAIFLTGTPVARDHARMMAAGAIGVIAKPFNPLTLAREVRALLKPASGG